MAEVTPADPSAQARTRARRTLIGSAILALTAVVVVPLVMDSKPRPWSDDVQLQIPSKDSKFDTPLQAPPAASPAAAASPTAAPTATKPAAPAASEAAPKAPAAPVAEPKAESKTETKSEPKPEAKAEPKPSPAAAPKETAKPETAKPETAKPAAAKTADPKAGKVILQAGAFTTEERIKAIEAELRKAGFAPYREEVPAKTGTVTRVRFTVASQDAAEKAIAKLAAAGITPKIIPQ
jgi:DedD protein